LAFGRYPIIRSKAGKAAIQIETLIDAGRMAASVRSVRWRGGCCASWWAGASAFIDRVFPLSITRHLLNGIRASMKV